MIKKLCAESDTEAAVAEGFSYGGAGALALADKVTEYCDKAKREINYMYALDASIAEKITAVATKVYGAKEVKFSDEAKRVLERLNADGEVKNYPVCIAKTQYSFSSDDKALGAPDGFTFEVRDVIPRTGAEFVVAVCGKILLMPGLGASPNTERITIDTSSGEVNGLM